MLLLEATSAGVFKRPQQYIRAHVYSALQSEKKTFNPPMTMTTGYMIHSVFGVFNSLGRNGIPSILQALALQSIPMEASDLSDQRHELGQEMTSVSG